MHFDAIWYLFHFFAHDCTSYQYEMVLYIIVKVFCLFACLKFSPVLTLLPLISGEAMWCSEHAFQSGLNQDLNHGSIIDLLVFINL